MSLKCSLLGHRFDESAVEHDREEDGSEVVIVTTELEACTRCGETRVVSENKEVRTTEAPEADAEAAGGDAGTADGDAETAEVPSTGSADDSKTVADDSAGVTDDAVLIDDADDATTVEGTGEATAVDEPDDAADTAVADDAAETGTTAESTGAELIGEAGSGEAAGDTGDVDDGTVSAPSGDEAPADDGPTAAEASVEDEPTETDDDGADDTTDPAEEDAEILGSDDAGAGSTDTEADAQSQARSEPTGIPDAASGASVADAGTDPDDDEVTDDAVIIDGDSGDKREPGEWPEETPTAGDDGTDVKSGAEADDTEDDSVVWSGESEDEPSEAGSGSADAEWPEEGAEETDDGPLGEWPEETMPDGTEEEGAERSLEETASPTVTVPEGMYKCPECGFTADVESSPHRAGDFCPECHHGTLVQDEDGGN